MLDFDFLQLKIIQKIQELTGNPYIWETDPLYMDEIIARVFILVYRDKGTENTSNNNINSHVNHNRPDVDNLYDTTESILKQYRYSEDKLRHMNENICDHHASTMNINLPYASNMESRQKGRAYDGANLLLLDFFTTGDGFKLLRHTLNGSICNSKKYSNKHLVEAYDEYNAIFNKLKNEDDHKKYITGWINMYRCETAMHFSLISDIADYICENKDNIKKGIPYTLFDGFWDSIAIPKDSVIGFNDVDYYNFLDYLSDLFNFISPDSSTENTPIRLLTPLQAFQVLRYKEYIPCFFEALDKGNMSELIDYVIRQRIIQSELVLSIYSKYSSFFDPFFNDNPEAIKDMYQFCKISYPVIENHKDLNFYTKNDDGKKCLNKFKIGRVRTLFKEYLKVEELKKFYPKKPH